MKNENANENKGHSIFILSIIMLSNNQIQIDGIGGMSAFEIAGNR